MFDLQNDLKIFTFRYKPELRLYWSLSDPFCENRNYLMLKIRNLNVIQDEGRPNVLVEEFGLIHAIVASISVILISELGDKTFFIAAIMAMRHSRLTVFLGAISALALMTVMSAFFGWMVTFISSVYTNYICVMLFLLFGVKMLKEAYSMPASGFNQEEFDEVHTEIKRKDEEVSLKFNLNLI